MSKPVITVTLNTVHMPKEVYQELLCGLDELDDQFGKTAESANARNWLLSATKRQETPAPVVSGEAIE